MANKRYQKTEVPMRGAQPPRGTDSRQRATDGSAMRFSLPDPMTARLKVSAQLTASVSNTRLK
jgi:hypothetical protein